MHVGNTASLESQRLREAIQPGSEFEQVLGRQALNVGTTNRDKIGVEARRLSVAEKSHA